MGLMRVYCRFACRVVAALVASLALAATAEAASLYDDFNDPSHLVRADLWRSFDSYSTGGIGSGRTDAVRAIDALLASPLPLLTADPSNPKLLIAKRFVLQPGAPSGSSDSDGYAMLQAANATGVQADVTMKLCLLGTAGFVQAGVEFAGFNDGTSPAPGNRIGDIFARLRISCSSTTNQAQITWNVFRCTNSACSTATSLGTGSFGAANIGQEYTLHATKSSGSSFVFTAVGQTQTFPVSGSPTAPPRVPFSDLMTRIDPTTPPNGGQWAVVATFDNVMIDQ
jgi:hypothetical protein